MRNQTCPLIIFAMAIVISANNCTSVSAQQSPQKPATTGVPSPFSGGGHGLPNGRDPSIPITASLNVTSAGDAAAKRGDWKAAAADYAQAILYWPDNQLAHYALGDHDVSIGDTVDAVTEYRAAIYTHPKPPRLPRINESNVQRLMKYALLLYQTGQTAEALNIYADGAHKLNYDQGKPARRVMLPTFGSAPGQLPLTPQNFQGMAHLGIGIDTTGSVDATSTEPIDNLREAAQLAPASAAAHFYLGKYLGGLNGQQGKAELEKAAALGDDQIRAAAERELKFVH